MSDLISAAKQALEALESSRIFVTSREKMNHPTGTAWYDEQIESLRQAIADAEKQEPYGYVWTSLKDGMETRFSRMYPANFYSPMDVISVYTHPQPAQPKE